MARRILSRAVAAARRLSPDLTRVKPAASQLIQRGDIQQRVARGLGMQSRSPAPELASELQGVILVEDLTKPNLLVDPAARTMWIQAVSVASPGNLSQVTIAVPSGSKSLVRIDQMVFVSGSMLVLVGFGTVESTNLTPPTWADQRMGSQSGVLVRNGAVAADNVSLPLFRIQGPSSGSQIIDAPGIILQALSPDPGVQDVLIIEGLTVNTQLVVGVKMTEFVL